MLTSETKRHIDAARQVLVGVVPNPASQIDQITNALIYKFMDDMDQAAIKAGGDPSFFIGDLEKYAWTRLMDSRLGNQDRMNLYVDALQKFSESKQLPSLFRDIFKTAFLPYRSPEVLGLFLKEIDYFDYSHSEELGNAYEYLLSVMSSQGDAGQFRTPRHIIDFIVAAVNPNKDDKILDPACGTAGFLISAYKHILEQHDGKNPDGTKNNEKPLTPDERRNLVNNFEGYDIDPGMVRISQVNMYLHQFKNPKIFQYDSLSQEERWGDKFDVILANPPFMSPKGGVKTHNKFSISSTRSEVLFVDYIMNHLRPKGRAGIIVPEGIIFQSGNAYKQLRKNMIEEGLYCVVSLPSGVFNPYAGVKTSILLFDKELAKKTDHILFIKIQHDGYELGAQRRKSPYDDLPLARDALARYKKHADENGTYSIGGWPEGKYGIDTHPNCQFVSKKEILESDDHNLSYERYRFNDKQNNTKWDLIELGEMFEMVNGRAFKKEEWNNKGLPIIRIANLNSEEAEFNYYQGDFDEKIRVISGDLLFSWSGTRGTSFGPHLWNRTDGLLNQHIYKFIPKIEVDIRFAHYLISSIIPAIEEQAHGAGGLVHITKEKLCKFKIPLPPIQVQKQIVNELDEYKKIIDGARQVYTNWKPKININPEWDNIELNNESVIKIIDGDRGKNYPQKTEFKMDGYCLFLNTSNVKKGYFDFTKCDFISRERDGLLGKGRLKKEDVVLTTRGTIGNSAYFDQKVAFEHIRINSGMIIFRTNADKLLPQFLIKLLQSELFIKQVKSLISGSAQPQLPIRVLFRIRIPIPPLEIQNQIVVSIEEEQKLIDANKKLVEIYDQKIEDKIAEIWGE